MKLLFLTRFSFFGVSGWRSEASTDLEKLLDPERLENRFNLFEKIAARSLAMQSDLDFDWILLSAKAMQKADKDRLRAIVKSTPGPGIRKVLFREHMPAGKAFLQAIWRNYQKTDLISTVVIDDDDALHSNFVAECKSACSQSWAERSPDADHVLTSFPKGISLNLREGGCEFYERHVPFTNLGLSMTAPANSRHNLFAMSHKRAGKRRPSRIVETEHPVYLRTVHQSNDSQAMLGKDPKPVTESLVQHHFPGIDFKNLT